MGQHPPGYVATSTYRMPLTTSRRSVVLGWPLVANAGRRGANSSHWASVKSLGYGFLLMPPGQLPSHYHPKHRPCTFSTLSQAFLASRPPTGSAEENCLQPATPVASQTRVQQEETLLPDESGLYSSKWQTRRFFWFMFTLGTFMLLVGLPALVVCQCWIDEYGDLSLMRASEVVRRQSTRIASRLRRCSTLPPPATERFGRKYGGSSIAGPAPRFQSRPYPSNCQPPGQAGWPKAWECSGPPTVRRCAALRQVQSLVQRGWVVGVQSLPRTRYGVVHHRHNTVLVRVVLIHHLLDHPGPIGFRTPVRHCHPAPSFQRNEQHEKVAHPLALVFVRAPGHGTPAPSVPAAPQWSTSPGIS